MLLLHALILFAMAAAAAASCGCTPRSLTYADLKEGKFQGDMILTSQQKMEILGLRNAQSNIWSQRTLIYDYAPHMRGSASTIEASLRYIEQMTNNCVRFRRRTSERDYVYVTSGNGCSSYVGNIRRGAQALSLDSGCFRRGTIVHEFMHALGFHHEQTRMDRDQYLSIDWSKIMSQYCFAFYKYNGNTFNTKFDYNSCMQYRATGFTCKAGVPVMRRRNGSTDLGNEWGMSATDALRIRRAYGCA